MTTDEILNYPYDPYLLLGVDADADDKLVAAAWKKAGSPQEGPLFEAYTMLKDEVSRRKALLLGTKALENPKEALGLLRKSPVYLGPGAWYDAVAQAAGAIEAEIPQGGRSEKRAEGTEPVFQTGRASGDSRDNELLLDFG